MSVSESDFVLDEALPAHNRKRAIFTLIFCAWMVANYIQVWGNSASEMLDSLAFKADPPEFPNSVQVWVLNITSVLFDTLVLAVAVGVFAYHHRRYATAWYMALGCLLRFFPILVLLPLIIWNQSLSSVVRDLARFLDYQAWILIALQLAGIVVASLVGMAFGKEWHYFDERDEHLGYIAGISKKLWAVLFIAMNPMLRFTVEASLVTLYTLTDRITRDGYWDFWGTEEQEYETGFSGLVAGILSLCIIWAIAAGIATLGIAAIQKKHTSFRRLRIVVVFVVIPILIVGVEILRNRTFFF